MSRLPVDDEQAGPSLLYEALESLRRQVTELRRNVDSLTAMTNAEREHRTVAQLIREAEGHTPSVPSVPDRPKPTRDDALRSLLDYITDVWTRDKEPVPASVLTRRYNRTFHQTLPFPAAIDELVRTGQLDFLRTKSHARLFFPAGALLNMTPAVRFRYANPNATDREVAAYLTKHAEASRDEAELTALKRQVLTPSEGDSK